MGDLGCNMSFALNSYLMLFYTQYIGLLNLALWGCTARQWREANPQYADKNINISAQLSSLAVCVNPGSAFNCYWKMPFRKKARITLENINNAEEMRLYYQINYTLTEVPEDEGYFHAQFRRSNPTQGSIHTLVDGIKGKGQYVGTYLAWRVNDNCWWGEGEIKFYMDGDKEYPTICGTGTEDYFCGSYNFENQCFRPIQSNVFCCIVCGLIEILEI